MANINSAMEEMDNLMVDFEKEMNGDTSKVNKSEDECTIKKTMNSIDFETLKKYVKLFLSSKASSRGIMQDALMISVDLADKYNTENSVLYTNTYVTSGSEIIYKTVSSIFKPLMESINAQLEGSYTLARYSIIISVSCLNAVTDSVTLPLQVFTFDNNSFAKLKKKITDAVESMQYVMSSELYILCTDGMKRVKCLSSSIMDKPDSENLLTLYTLERAADHKTFHIVPYKPVKSCPIKYYLRDILEFTLNAILVETKRKFSILGAFNNKAQSTKSFELNRDNVITWIESVITADNFKDWHNEPTRTLEIHLIGQDNTKDILVNTLTFLQGSSRMLVKGTDEYCTDLENAINAIEPFMTIGDMTLRILCSDGDSYECPMMIFSESVKPLSDAVSGLKWALEDALRFDSTKLGFMVLIDRCVGRVFSFEEDNVDFYMAAMGVLVTVLEFATNDTARFDIIPLYFEECLNIRV